MTRNGRHRPLAAKQRQNRGNPTGLSKAGLKSGVQLTRIVRAAMLGIHGVAKTLVVPAKRRLGISSQQRKQKIAGATLGRTTAGTATRKTTAGRSLVVGSPGKTVMAVRMIGTAKATVGRNQLATIPGEIRALIAKTNGVVVKLTAGASRGRSLRKRQATAAAGMKASSGGTARAPAGMTAMSGGTKRSGERKRTAADMFGKKKATGAALGMIRMPAAAVGKTKAAVLVHGRTQSTTPGSGPRGKNETEAIGAAEAPTETSET
mmetsp:Transcript_136569/g.255075  ORF Transcript_136569/g.255075 Transcript_136569/m.255075 type:complete len:263 (+) Transcript_136569:580-1368(+)